MKVLILSGSRNPQGQTGRAAAALAQGVRDGGAECQTIFLALKKLEHCRQCGDDGWGLCRKEGRCTIDDDFAEVVSAVREADVLACATPVYWGDLSESMRAFLDRLRRTACWQENGKKGIAGKPAIGVCIAGGGGGGAASCCTSMDRVLSTCGFDYVDSVSARRQNLEMKLPILQLTGKWLATCPRSR
jgi:multimeric flavodoxin WrbA